MSELYNKDRVGEVHRLAKELADMLKDQGHFRSCLSCSYWQQNPSNEYQFYCELNKQPPPPRIICNGCDKHSDNIPF